jgi:hypothetical protein
MKFRKSRLWLCLPMSLLCAFDVSVTLHGQQPNWWAGQHELALEGNPVAEWFMLRGPVVFIVWSFAWLAIINAGGLFLPRFWAAAWAFWVCFIHFICSATWLKSFGWPGGIGILVLLGVTVWLLVWSWDRAGLGKKSPRKARRARKEAVARQSAAG